MDKEEVKRQIAICNTDKALDKLIEEINQVKDAQVKNDLIFESCKLKRILGEKTLE